MKNFFKGKFGTALILIATFILAGVAIFTAIRLYQLRQQAVAPNVPSSIPQAQEISTCTLSFSLSAVSTPGETPTATPVSTPTETPVVTPVPTPTRVPTPVPTPTRTTASVAPTPTAPTLPQSGTDWPTIAGAGLGILVILGSLLLAI